MSARDWMRSFGAGRRRTASFPKRVGSLAALSVLGLLTQACSGMAPTPAAEPDPANPATRVPKTVYSPVTGSYSSSRPVEPRPWGEQDQGGAPTPKP